MRGVPIPKICPCQASKSQWDNVSEASLEEPLQQLRLNRLFTHRVVELSRVYFAATEPLRISPTPADFHQQECPVTAVGL